MKTVTVFLTKSALASFKDQFVSNDSQNDFQFVFAQVRNLAKSARMVSNSGKLQVSLFANGQTIPKEEFLADVKLPEPLPEDATWVPQPGLLPHTTKVGDKTWELLLEYSCIFLYRITQYNNSIPAKYPNRSTLIAPPPTCMEQLLHEAIFPRVMDEVGKNIDKELDNEYAELNTPKARS